MHMLKDTSPPSKRRSRITSGARLLPTVRGDSQWGRIMGDVYNSALAHCGGADYVSELQRLQCRRIGALEAELVHAENRIAAARTAGEEPPPSLLDLYCRLSSAQRRHCEALGWQRTARDITPDLRKYIEQKSADTRVGGDLRGLLSLLRRHVSRILFWNLRFQNLRLTPRFPISRIQNLQFRNLRNDRHHLD